MANNEYASRVQRIGEDVVWDGYHRRAGAIDDHTPEYSDHTYWELLNKLGDYTLFEDDHLLIVNKPAGIVTLEAPNCPIGVQEIVQYAKGEVISVAHRLDVHTSGVLVMTKNRRAARMMNKQFGEKEACNMEKKYLAIVNGTLPAQLHIGGYVGHKQGQKGRFVDAIPADTEGYDYLWSETIAQPLMHYALGRQEVTAVDVQILSGRRHQIRLAMQHIRHPIVGDRGYSKKPFLSERQLLHARSLTFMHPVTHQIMTVEAPIPQDMANYLPQ